MKRRVLAPLGVVAVLGTACDSEWRLEGVAQAEEQKTIADGNVHQRVTTEHGPIHIWKPDRYSGKGRVVVYVHGYYTHVDEAWVEHRLPAQFAASGVDAVFVACESPSSPRERVSWQSLGELLGAVERAIGALPTGGVTVVGHSAGYLTILGWLGDPRIDRIVLVDAAYGEVDRWKAWAKGDAKRRLIFVGELTRPWTDRLHAKLPGSVVLDHVPQEQERLPRLVYVRSRVGHMALVTGGEALPALMRMTEGM